jgi:hypothetical protein
MLAALPALQFRFRNNIERTLRETASSHRTNGRIRRFPAKAYPGLCRSFG